jgi:hypothetical protein
MEFAMGVIVSGSFKSFQTVKVGVPVPPPSNSVPTTNLVLSLDASDTNSLTLGAGNVVTQWNDLSGNNNNATQLNTSGPVWSSNAFQSTYAGVTFSGSLTEVLTGDDSNFPLGSDARTIFIVYEPSGSNRQSIFMHGTNVASGDRFDVRQDDNVVTLDIRGSAQDWNDPNSRNSPKLLTLVYPAGVSATSTSVNMRLNQVALSKSGFTVSGTPSTADNAYYIGARIDNFEYAGVISEIAVYDGELTTAEYQNVESILTNKWGL